MSSPRMTVRKRTSWTVRIALAGLLLCLGGLIAVWIFDLGQGISGRYLHNARGKLTAYEEEIAKLSAERNELSATANGAESQLNIERSAQKQLAAQVKTLESENMRLKEDLAFFESLLPNATGAQGIAIRRLKIDQIAPNQLRYRLLIMQGGKGDQQFVGNLQLTVNALQGGRNAMMIFPEGNSVELDKFKLSFKHYQRVEGVLTIPEGTAVKTVQARILEKGQIRVQQSANL